MENFPLLPDFILLICPNFSLWFFFKKITVLLVYSLHFLSWAKTSNDIYWMCPHFNGQLKDFNIFLKIFSKLRDGDRCQELANTGGAQWRYHVLLPLKQHLQAPLSFRIQNWPVQFSTEKSVTGQLHFLPEYHRVNYAGGTIRWYNLTGQLCMWASTA